MGKRSDFARRPMDNYPTIDPNAPTTPPKTVTVATGDSLSVISGREYGVQKLWPIIYDANKGLIGANPDNIRVGTTLVIPPIESVPDATKERALQRADMHLNAWIAWSKQKKPGYPTLPREVTEG